MKIPTRRQRTRRATMALGLAAATAIGASVLLVAALQREAGRFVVDARRDMLLEGDRVRLVEGFGERTSLEVWHDAEATNPDRDGIGLLLGRDSRLRWAVSARGGTFRARVARLVPRPIPPAGVDAPPLGEPVALAADGLPLTLRVAGDWRADDEPAPSSLRDGGPDSEHSSWFVGRDRAGPLPEVVVDVPGAAAREAVVPRHWREGPAVDVELELPDGAEVIEISVASPEGYPPNGAVLLLSPRIELDPLDVRVDDHPLRFLDTTQRLLAAVQAAPDDARDVRIGRRLTEADAEVGEPVFEAPVDALVSFTGRTGRPAIALAGEAAVDVAVDLRADTELHTALALDARHAPGTVATVEVLVDGELAAVEVVDSAAWRELRVPLGDWAGRDRTLTLRLGESEVVSELVLRQEIDFVAEGYVTAGYVLERPRVGVANPLLSTPTSRPRHAASPSSSSVIVIHVETLRADVLPMYGGPYKDLTPNLERLADRSVVWDVAIAPSPWTAPSTATLFTGLPPAAHGVLDHQSMVLPADVPTLPERARDHGIPTGVFIANDILTGEAGFARGATAYAELPYFNARQVTALAEGFLDNHVGQQFLLVLHYWDPHHHYNAPVGWRDRYLDPGLVGHDVFGAADRLVTEMSAGRPVSTDAPDVRALRQRYLGDIAYLDAQVGRLLDALEERGIDESTVIVFTSDHGEEFFEHGLFGHGSNVYDETLRVPLIIHAPGEQFGPARRVPEVVSTGGIHATVLDLLGIHVDDSSLLPALTFRDEGRPHAVGETRKGIARDGLGDPLRRRLDALRTNEHLLIRSHPVDGEERDVEYSLYDLTANPEANQPLTAPEVRPAFKDAKTLLEEADAWASEHRASSLAPGLDDEGRAMLEQMGYVEKVEKVDDGK